MNNVKSHSVKSFFLKLSVKNVKSHIVKKFLPQNLHEECQISLSEEFVSQIVHEECEISMKNFLIKISTKNIVTILFLVKVCLIVPKNGQPNNCIR